MKHENAEMICVKVNNMNLIMFIKRSKHCEWSVINEAWDLSFITGSNPYSFFLCLPQHKEACLHWLNGGSAQYLSNGMGKWIDFGDSKSWSITHLFMTDECDLRIKPKKEKRWIGVSKSSCHATGHYETEQEAINITDSQPWASAYAPWQFIEIEVEV